MERRVRYCDGLIREIARSYPAWFTADDLRKFRAEIRSAVDVTASVYTQRDVVASLTEDIRVEVHERFRVVGVSYGSSYSGD